MTAPGVLDGIRAAQLGLFINALLAVAKLIAGIVGNAFALVADAVESMGDIAASFVVWGGLTIAAQPPDDEHPFGHGKAEALAAAIVALLLLGAAAGIAFKAIAEIRAPNEFPAPWTLAVLVAVVAVKGLLSRRVGQVGAQIRSTAVSADAAHHMSDAVTSAAAFAGILAATVGHRLTGDLRWAQADDWAALFATAVIAWNGGHMLLSASHELMDRMPGEVIVGPIRRAALSVPEVRAIEKLAVRKTGLTYRVSVHVQADPGLSLREAHVVSGKVKGAIRSALLVVDSVLVHMEPYEEGAPSSGRGPERDTIL